MTTYFRWRRYFLTALVIALGFTAALFKMTKEELDRTDLVTLLHQTNPGANPPYPAILIRLYLLHIRSFALDQAKHPIAKVVAYSENEELTKQLIQHYVRKGAHIDAELSPIGTPLYIATIKRLQVNGNLEVFKTLLEAGANPNKGKSSSPVDQQSNNDNIGTSVTQLIKKSIKNQYPDGVSVRANSMLKLIEQHWQDQDTLNRQSTP